MSLIVAIIVCMSAYAVLANAESSEADSSDYSGDCGTDAKYEFDPDTGELKIFGNGEMGMFGMNFPWKSFSDSIKTVSVGGYVTSITDLAFFRCSNLTSISLNAYLSQISSKAFEGCSSLAKITLDEGNRTYCLENGVLFQKDQDDKKVELVVYPAGKTDTSYTVPETVTCIDRSAFSYCSSLVSVTLPEALQKIEEDSFLNCSSLTTVKLPKSMVYVGERAFTNCASLTSIDIDKENTSYCSIDGVLFLKGDSGEPARLIVYPAGKTNTTFTVPESVTIIQDEAFHGASKLVSVNLGNVEKVDSMAFFDCTSLTSVTIPESVIIIGTATFQGCTALSSVELPNKLTQIGSSAFSGCTKLTSITIPDSVTSLGGQAFFGCSALTTVNSLGKITSIGENTFSNCTSLITITLPDTLQSIGEEAFAECISLSSFKIPASLSSISDSAFMNCRGLTEFVVDSQNEVYCSENGVLYTKDETELIQYPSAKGDKEFTVPAKVTKINPLSFYCCINLESVKVAEGNEYYCSEDGILYDSDKTTLILYPAKKSGTSYVMPDTVSKIFDTAFYGCVLTEITLSSSFTGQSVIASIPQFGLCQSLIKVNLGDRTDLKCENGAILSGDGKVLILCLPGNTGEYTITKGVEEIGAGSFIFTSKIVALNIPDSVKKIDNMAFSGNTPDLTVESGSISLSKITFGYGLAEIDSTSFSEIKFYANGKQLDATPANLNGKTFTICNGTLSTGFSHDKIPAEGHVLVDVPEKESTFFDKGVKAHQHCKLCGAEFLDGKEATTDDLSIPAGYSESKNIACLFVATILLLIGLVAVYRIHARAKKN